MLLPGELERRIIEAEFLSKGLNPLEESEVKSDWKDSEKVDLIELAFGLYNSVLQRLEKKSDKNGKKILSELVSYALEYHIVVNKFYEMMRHGSPSSCEAIQNERSGLHDRFIDKLLEFESYLREKYSNSGLGRSGIYAFNKEDLNRAKEYPNRTKIAVWGYALLIGLKRSLVKDVPDKVYAMATPSR